MSITSVVNDLVTSVSVINALKPLPPTISGYSVAGKDDLALDPAGGQTVQINGTGFLPGATITFDGSAVAVVTYVNPNQLTFTSPAKTAGTYTIYAVNPDGGTAIYVPGIIYSTLPTWTTAAGSLGSYYETTSISNTVVAAGDAPVTYSLYSGSLPTGSTLSANGVITGTAPVDSSSTTYSFTIQASDAQLQDSTRSFSLTINVDAVTWVSPANNTTYTSTANSAISTVTLSATDAAGYAVSYSANALPTGLSLTGSNISGTPTVVADSSTLLTATAATTNRTAVRTINWSITVANDVYFEYNTLLIPGASTTFVDDASTNNFAVTINGDTKPNNFNPYTPGYYSNYFDGNGDYLAITGIPISATGTFTVECWINTPSINTAAWIYTQRQSISAGRFGIALIPDSTGFHIDVSLGPQASPVSTTNGISYNTWNHIAVVRDSSNNLKIFINGVLDSTTASYTYSIEQSEARIGFLGNSATQYFLGYISNTRVTNTAVYSTTFTPSTTPLTAISGTTLLTCQSNRFLDNSTNNFTLTVAGNTSISSFDPFVPNSSYSTYGSGYFDGTGDYLQYPSDAAFQFGTGNFTIEFWWYPLTLLDFQPFVYHTNNNGVIGTGQFVIVYNTTFGLRFYSNSGSTDIKQGAITGWSVNQWYHVAIVRNSDTLTLYRNGTSLASGSVTGVTIGAAVTTQIMGEQYDPGYSTGYFSNYRVVKGTAVYTTTFTPPTAPLTAISGTSLLVLQNNQSVNNSVFLDNSTNNFLVTRNGNTTQGTFSPYGGNWSNYFDGTSYFTSSTSQIIPAGSFTVECWVYVTNTSNQGFVAQGTSGNSARFSIAIENGLWWTQIGNTIINVGTPVTNTWNYLAATFNGSTLTLYVNGTSIGTASTGTSAQNTTLAIGTLGASWATTGYFTTGYISNVRVSSVVRTIATPTAPYTSDASTKVLFCQSNRFVDASNNAYAFSISAGSPTVQRFSPFNPSSVTATSYSGYFDGTGDYLATTSTQIIPASTTYTVEAWVYFTGDYSDYREIVTQGSSGNANRWLMYIEITTGILRIQTGSPNINTSFTVPQNTWTHLAFVNNSGSYTVYANGTSVGSGTNIVTPQNTYVTVGAFQSGAEYFQGYISNVRITNTAVYTSAFTPSTTPLTAISGTSLLTCQSPTFIDNSTNNFTISAFGNSQPTIQNPFGFTSATTNGYTVSTIGGSGYFDGTGDYLTLANPAVLALGTSNFTIEFWIYTATTTEQEYIDFRPAGTSSGAYPMIYSQSGSLYYFVSGVAQITGSISNLYNSWIHITISRSSGSTKMFINGTQAGSTWADSTNYLVGTNRPAIGYNGNTGSFQYNGYMSDLRINRGTALYTSNFVPPSAPLTAVQNTVLLNNMTSAGIYDAAMMNNMETVADAKLSTAVSKFGGSSMEFDGTGDQLYSIANQNTAFGSGDFTIEFWVYGLSSAARQDWLDLYNGTVANRIQIIWVSSQFGYYQNNTFITGGGTYATNTWYHVALTRSSGSNRLFVNGTQVGTTATNTTNFSGNALYLGKSGTSGGTDFNGYIDDLRITKGIARYTSNFTAPTTAFPIY